MEKVLVLTDFSYPAYEALFYTSGILKRRETTFYLLNAYTAKTQPVSTVADKSRKSLMAHLKRESEEGLLAVVHRIQLDRENPRHRFIPVSREGELDSVINAFLKEQEISFLAMGNRGQSARAAVFFGSSVVRVIRNVYLPVLAIPEGITESRPIEIAIAADFDHRYSEKQLSVLISFVKETAAALRILHLSQEEHLDEEQMKNYQSLDRALNQVAHTLYWMPDYRKKADAINSYILENKIGLLAMVHYPHGFLDRILGEAVVNKVSFMVEVPMLILPPENEK